MTLRKKLTREGSDVTLSPAPYEGVMLEKTYRTNDGVRTSRMVLSKADCEWLSNQFADIFVTDVPELP